MGGGSGSSSIVLSEAKWADLALRHAAFVEGRRRIRNKKCVVYLKVKDRWGLVLKATFDSRYWMMDPRDFQDPPKPGSAERRAAAKALKAPSFLF
jgi:hypothetical protein